MSIESRRRKWRRTLVVLAAAFVVTSVGVMTAVTVASERQGPGAPPSPIPTCVRVVSDATGEGDWYCGDVIRVPSGTHVVTTGFTPCANEDGSGSELPCWWDARTRGAQPGGDSFTILPVGAPVNGVQRVLFRYLMGVTVEGSVPVE